MRFTITAFLLLISLLLRAQHRDSTSRQLDSIVIRADGVHRDQPATVPRSTLSGAGLEQTRGLSLGESLKGITGVNSLQMGPSISKPVIHGVYSNRVLIMNNGVRQEGQNWGNDHAPEIDPFIATKITVVKGAGSIRYGSDAIGGVVLLDPKDLPGQPGVDGELNLVGMTNGHVGVASGMVEGAFADGLSWRLQGTLKQAGNAQAAHYYLGNTGFRENDFSAALQYKHHNYGTDLYYSQFDTKIGIADASVVGSLADFEQAIARSQPAVSAGFAYGIDRPYQTVLHRLLKAGGYLDLHNGGRLEATFAYQHDTRKEYESDPAYNQDSSVNTNTLADIAFDLNTYTTDVVWNLPVMGRFTGSIGVDYITHGNIQQHTSYQALIPNFVDYGGGVFALEKYKHGKWLVEAGLRYDYRWLRAFELNPTYPTLEDKPTYNWQDPTVSIGATYTIDPHWSVDVNSGTAWRAPQVIELFANGIHQSAGAWEIGDSTLTLEQAFNNNLSFVYTSRKLTVQAGGYVNFFHHYIYAKPDLSVVQGVVYPTIVQTNQGAYPAFTYTQVDALFEGIDLDVDYDFAKHFSLISKTTIVRARNLAIHQGLINVPADRFDNKVRYTLPRLGRLRNAFLGFGNLAVAKQYRVPPNSDFTTPPPGYVLWSAEAGCSIPFQKRTIDISLSGTNLTNVAYRDYMNQFRYYVDDLGRNIVLRILIPFHAL
jgi:iron complex outermembrane receptor protein